MYSLVRSKKIWVENTQQSPLQFCIFLNNTNILLVMQDKTFSIINISGIDKYQCIYESSLPSSESLIDCKRICKDKGAIITEGKGFIIFIQINEDKQVIIKQMPIQHASFTSNVRTVASLISFSNGQFVIEHRSYEDKIFHFYVLTQKQDSCFQYTSRIISEQIQWVSSNLDVVKPLPASQQFVIYQQHQTSEDVDWRMKMLSINKTQNKVVDLKSFLTGAHLIIEVIVRQANEYFIFTRKQIVPLQEMQVWSCKMYENQGTYVQSAALLKKFQFNNINLVQVVAVNYNMNYFIAKSYAHLMVDGEIFDNSLQIINLQTGAILEKQYCNIKQFDVSLNHQLIIDYSQQINHFQKCALHVRALLTKKVIYHHFIQQSQVFKKQLLNPSFQSMILNLL